MSRVTSATLLGVDGVAVEVEVRISSQLPRVDVVGLPEAAVRESAARVRAAIASAGERFPDRRVTVNLAPADVRKSGPGLDLPIAVGILAAAGDDRRGGPRWARAGRRAGPRRAPAPGARRPRPRARRPRRGLPRAWLSPSASAPEAALAPGLDVFAAGDLAALLACAARRRGAGARERRAVARERQRRAASTSPTCAARRPRSARSRSPPRAATRCCCAVRRARARRCSRGGSRASCRPLAFDEALEVTRIHGAAGLLAQRDGRVRAQRSAGPSARPTTPRAAPACSAAGARRARARSPSPTAACCSSTSCPSSSGARLESLRQVLEDRRVVVARAQGSCAFPAAFQLVGEREPLPVRLAPLGRARLPLRRRRRRALRRAPLGPAPRPHRPPRERARGALARSRRPGAAARRARRCARASSAPASARPGASRAWRGALAPLNAEIPAAAIETLVAASAEARALLARAVDRFALSARAAHRVLRVARTSPTSRARRGWGRAPSPRRSATALAEAEGAG